MSVSLYHGIDWVGYVDWSVRDFHGYNTARGATYNAYLIRDEKTALIDTVKDPFAGDLHAKLSTLTDPAGIDYVVCNHAEPDHAGSLPRVMEALPKARLVCNEKCRAALGQHFDVSGWNFFIVDTGDTLSLGRRSLYFMNTPMAHWPESMFTYVPEEKLLFSMDVFGQHYASSQRFDDEAPLDILMEEAKTYYANILLPFGKRVTVLLEQIKDLDIETIAPAHGLIWRGQIPRILEAYRNWANHLPKPKVMIIYDTMWDSTGRMARAIFEGASIPGIEAQLVHIRSSNLTRIAMELLDTATIAFGSSTLNQSMMPMAGAVLTYLKGLKPVGKAGFAFGSYGWSKGGPEAIEENLRAMKWEILREPILAQYRPTPELLDECRTAGRKLAEKAGEMAARGGRK